MALPGVKGVINGLAVKAWNSASERENLAKNFRAGRQSFRFSGWNLPQGHIDIQEDAEVFASNGKLGRVRGLVFARSDMKVQYLIVDTGKFLFNAWHWLPFNYLEGSYFPHNPAIFLKINRAEFKEVSQSSERQDMNGCTGLVSICIFGKKMPIKYGSKKVGWLGGALLGPTGPDSFNLSYYLLKTDHSTRPLLLPGEALEAGTNDSALYLKPDQQQVLLHPYRFNGFNPPASVVKRLLEKLAWSSVMQLRGGRLRVEYMEGEIFLKGVLPAKVSPEPLLSIVGSVPGVWRVHNLIVTKPTPVQIEQKNL
ncbi:MAG TPA: BON domain-containing protein [Chloroflexia bacterium]|nr:BON domain-containing protein [Chloroflexia bacterium]